MTKKTPWFPKNVKPVRKGWYEVKGCTGFLDCSGMHFWNGKNWAYSWSSESMFIPVKPLQWRGLMK